MAISLENANLTWQRVKIALAGAHPAIQAQFKALKQSLSQDYRNRNLQFVVVSDLTADAVVADAACKVVGVYLKKQATATAAYFKGNDSASATVASANALMIKLPTSGAEQVFIHPAGMAQANGFTIGSDTSGTATTDSTSGDGPNGFVLICAP